MISLDKEVISSLNYFAINEPKILAKIMKLIYSTAKNPFDGIGKPEPLKHEWSGYWSRRINQEHRLVYKVKDNTLYIASCRFHYD